MNAPMNTPQEKKEEKPKELAAWEDLSPRNVFRQIFDDDFWLSPFGAWRTPRILSTLERRWFPRIDVSETDREVKVVADVPGVNPDNIDIDVQDNRMILSGHIEQEKKTEERPYRYERSYGEFRREFMLPTRVKEEEIKANYKDGVLTVTIPKAEETRKSRIKIEKL